ncbi:pentatricopeptide repeat (PPR-like) superfamily protein [Wolffia australiana]
MARSQRRAFLRRQHAVYLTTGGSDSSIWCWLLKGYLGEGLLQDALAMMKPSFPSERKREVLPLLLKACGKLKLLSLGETFHGVFLKEGLTTELCVGTTLVSMYGKCGAVADARKLFDEMGQTNTVTCNAMIAGYCDGRDVAAAQRLFDEMADRTPVTWTVMMQGLAKAGDMAAARELFDRTPPRMKTVVTWTALVQGYAAKGLMAAAREVFEEMPSRNFFAWSSMIAGYFKAGCPDDAREVFDRMPERNLVNWNALIAGYAQSGLFNEAIDCFRRMMAEGFEPDEVTSASALSACAQAGSLELGRDIHGLIERSSITVNQFVLNGLVDMYAKCGDLPAAERIFRKKTKNRKNRACWNAMISGLASHGRSEEALGLFSEMEGEGEVPCGVTCLAVLSACSHGGFLEQGLEIFARMETKYGVVPTVEHYGCLIDLLGRAGRVKEACQVMRTMPMDKNDAIWGALLGACRVHGEEQLAEEIALEAGLRSRDDDRFVFLANIYAASSRWEEAEQMRNQAGRKIPGCSSLT